MGTAAKIILRSALGVVCGTISGAALLALPTYFSTKTGFLGPESAWWPLAAIVGGFWGAIAGAVIGFLVSKFQTKKLMSAVIGTGVGMILVALWIIAERLHDWDLFINVLGCVPIAAVIGVIVSSTVKTIPAR